ncbi:MAG: hypothetical protein IPN76_16860 [Saprospiraceae bacterium]|nr:hypothetical protein [Saprospiraceae bacterium]
MKTMSNTQQFTPAPPAMPLPTGITLGTVWTSPPPPPLDAMLNQRCIGMADDGSIFVGGSTGLYAYSQANKAWSHFIAAYEVWQIAAVSANLVYILDQSQGLVVAVDGNGNDTVLPDIGKEITAVCISATKDGLLWATDTNGNLNSYDVASNSWAQINNGGYNITQLSVGNASFAYALADGQNGNEVIYFDGNSWQQDNNFGHTPPNWIGAASDGTAWATIGSMIFRKLPGLAWKEMKSVSPATFSSRAIGNPTQFLGMLYYSGNSMTSPNFPYNSYVLQCLQTGLVDNAPTPWPPMNSDEEIGYNAISAKVNQTGKGGIRSAYTNLDNSFSDWRQDIHDMKMPAGIQNADNWKSIRQQIMTELEYVTSINKLFVNINTLTQDVAINNSNLLNSVGDNVGLSVSDNKDTTVSLILSGMFFGVLGAIDNVLPPPANWIVTLISSGLSTGLSVLENSGQHNPPGYALQVALGKISDTLTSLFDNANTANGNYQTAILQDWGMLEFAGNASQHQWSWEPNTTPDLTSQAAPVFKTFFYQALIPARWKTVYTYWAYESLGPFQTHRQLMRPWLKMQARWMASRRIKSGS